MTDTDACNEEMICILLWKLPDGPAKLIGYWSLSWKMAEQGGDTQRHCESVDSAILLQMEILENLKILCTWTKSPCTAFLTSQSMHACNGNLAYWRISLSELKFDFVYNFSFFPSESDALSCLQTTEIDRAQWSKSYMSSGFPGRYSSDINNGEYFTNVTLFTHICAITMTMILATSILPEVWEFYNLPHSTTPTHLVGFFNEMEKMQIDNRQTYWSISQVLSINIL